MKPETPAAWLRRCRNELAAHGVEDADSAARLLVTRLLDKPLSSVLLDAKPLAPAQAALVKQALQRRLDGEPVQYILGQADFYGLTLRVTPEVLIPRMDTETLVHQALIKAPPNARVLDVCTGSGCVALAVKHERPDCTIAAADLSPAALAVARDNGKTLGLDVDWRLGDLCAPLAGRRFDVIVSNPPYISQTEYEALSPLVREHEPPMALLAGPEGLDLYTRLIPQAAALLSPGGWLCLEIGSAQADAVQALCRAAGLKRVSLTRDLSGLARVVSGRKG